MAKVTSGIQGDKMKTKLIDIFAQIFAITVLAGLTMAVFLAVYKLLVID